MAAIITFNPTAFRTQFPAFANDTKYPDATLENYFEQATCIVSDRNYGWLANFCRELALNLLVAHLATLFDKIAAGQTPGLVQSSSIDKISVSLTPPPLKNQFQFWLNLTPYGQQLLVMLQVRSVGGFYFGGLPETAAFRKTGGVF